MHLPLVLLAGLSLPGALPNLDLSEGKLTHWQGEGGRAISLGSHKCVTTADNGAVKKALLYRSFVVPEGALSVEFAAAVYRPRGVAAGEMLDVVLEAARRVGLTRQVRQGDAWVDAPELLGPRGDQLRQYRWLLGGYAGKTVRIAIVDQDPRAGCHLVTTGFRLVTRDDSNFRAFTEHMRTIQQKHKLPRAQRFDSKHFVALSTADAGYSEYRLGNCETIYAVFFPHFRKRGFEIGVPAEKLMVAIFDTQDGMDAYLGQKIPASVTGVYHPGSNRLVVYDFGNNRTFTSSAARAAAEARRGKSDLERERKLVTFNRAVRDHRDDTNISTVMHEVAHQLSFNCGMLNRQGDVPVWLAEGLAVYCESTVKGAWQGIGESNRSRAGALVPGAAGKGSFIPLRELVGRDDWIRKARRVEQIILGYSQSWALFRMLIDERPRQLKAYMKLIYDRRTPEHRLTDFAAAFGNDLPALEKRYQAYMREIARGEAR